MSGLEHARACRSGNKLGPQLVARLSDVQAVLCKNGSIFFFEKQIRLGEVLTRLRTWLFACFDLSSSFCSFLVHPTHACLDHPPPPPKVSTPPPPPIPPTTQRVVGRFLSLCFG